MVAARAATVASAAAAAALAPLRDPRTCKGYERQYKDCSDLPKCYACEPVDCAFSEWGDWFEGGGCTGVCFRHRSIATSNNECGAPCGGLKQETKRCLSAACVRVPQDCQFGDWGQWSECAEGDFTAQKVRSRRIALHPRHGGAECSGATNETLPCGKNPAVDCAFSEWGAWTECSASCGGGWHSQMRRVLTRASLGGRTCDGTTRRTEPCNTQACGAAKSCVLGAWSDWSGCGLVGGVQKYRSREVEQAAENGGEPCTEAVKETVGCPVRVEAEVPCRLSVWTDWASCSRSCGGGQTYRRRRVQEGPQHGGACPSENLHETKACGAEPCVPPGVNDCALSDWGSWSECPAKCGVGVIQRERKVLAAAKFGGRGCTAALKESQACYATEETCGSTDCEWADWEEWSACTSSCGGGTRRRERIIKVAPTHGGQLCSPEDKSEIAPCGTESCEVCVDGAWSDWEAWSGCSATCGEGYRSRHRDVAQHPNDCGKPVVGYEDEYELCSGMVGCEPDIDCALSEWSTWSACSGKCFGVAERTRSIVRYASGKGKACHMEPAKEMAQCNPSVGGLVPVECGLPEPEPCALGQWSDWGSCSSSCDGGQKLRMRQLLSPARNGGEPCAGELSETAPCGVEQCPQDCQDCQWGEWSDWSACSRCGDQRYRRRGVLTMPNHCGKPCDAAAAKETSSCESTCDEVRYCAWSDWSSFSPCSAECGPATRLRQRALTFYAEKPNATLFAGPPSMACSGAQMEVGACEQTPCGGERAPVDCAFGEWSDWSAPTCTQLCERHRVITQMSRHGGEFCDGQLVETKRCERDCRHAEDCVLSDWGEWGHCEKEESQRYRSRAVLQYASNGGQECQGTLEETASCSAPPAPILPCKLSLWSDWGVCSQSCGGGLHTRQRKIQDPAENGGSECEGQLEELRMCNSQQCEAAPVPCVMDEWSEWSECSSDSGDSRSRERKVLREPTNGGTACSASLKEVAPCNRTVDCALSQWTAWDECDKSCGGGQQARHRQVVQNPKNGGMLCSPSLMEVQGCNLAPCNRRDCAVSDWSEWNACTASCGSGQQGRSRKVVQLPQDGGEGCQMKLEEARACRDNFGAPLPACPVVDCVWGLWSDWSSCSCKCDGGMRTRDRHIIQSPQVGGAPCKVWNKEETEPCNTQKCSEQKCIDGQWDEWQDWEPCSKSCDGGVTWRVRHVLSEANECGKPVTGDSRVYASCNAGVPCEPDVDCAFSDWSVWSDCSKTCDGVMSRSRRIAVHGRGKGAHCLGDLKQTAPCGPGEGEEKPAACVTDAPTDCAVSDWGAWDSCTTSCGGGQMSRSRAILQEPKNGGRCPTSTLAETIACNSQACPDQCMPVDCKWAEWSSWSACDKCGGEKRRFRHVLSVARCGGGPCDDGLSEEVTNCTRQCHEPTYCAFGDWESWGSCSATCGSGVHSRSRRLQITQLASVRVRVLEDGLEGGDLEAKFQQLRLETQDLKRRHVQGLAVAFASGLFSLVVGLAAVRSCSKGRTRGLSVHEAQFDLDE